MIGSHQNKNLNSVQINMIDLLKQIYLYLSVNESNNKPYEIYRLYNF